MMITDTKKKRELYKLKKIKNGTPLKIFVLKLTTNLITKILKKYGKTFKSFLNKLKKPAKLLKSKESILQYL